MVETLADLIAPLPTETLRDVLRARKLFYLPRAITDPAAGRLDWDTLMQAVADGTYPPDLLRVTRQGTPLPAIMFTRSGKADGEALAKLMAHSGSIIAYGLNRYMPALGGLRRAVAEELGEHVVLSAIATAGAGGALHRHYDEQDVFSVQLTGRKRWRIERDPIPDPVPGMTKIPCGPEGELAMDVTLAPGDVLFVPAGYRHCCETVDSRSLHMSLMFWPLTVSRLLELLAKTAVDHPADRAPLRPMPPIAQLEATLAARVSGANIEDLIVRHLASQG